MAPSCVVDLRPPLKVELGQFEDGRLLAMKALFAQEALPRLLDTCRGWKFES